MKGLVVAPTSHLLFVTDHLLRYVRSNRHACFFLRVDQLKLFAGNQPHPTKMDPLLRSIVVEENELDLPLPILTINCLHGTAVLVEGNNRLAVFEKMGKCWFPVHVRIEDCAVPLNGNWVSYSIPADLDGKPYLRKGLWLQCIETVLDRVFGFDILQLDQEIYLEDGFTTSHDENEVVE